MNKLSITLALTLALMLALTGNASAENGNKECDKWKDYKLVEAGKEGKFHLLKKGENAPKKQNQKITMDMQMPEPIPKMEKNTSENSLDNCWEHVKGYKEYKAKAEKRKQAKK